MGKKKRLPGQISVWEPTPRDIMKEVLHFSQISSSDMIFDLGCGDGRMLIEAAKEYGASAIGFDINGWLVRKTRQDARKNGVGHLVKARKQNMMKIQELHRATVIYMYLPDGAIRKIFPILYDQCKKGTKIITLGSYHVTGDNKNYPVYKEMVINNPERFWKIRMWII